MPVKPSKPQIIHRRRNEQHRTPLSATPDVALATRVTVRINEALALTGLGQTTLKEMIADGTLRSTKVRGVRLIYADSLRELLGLGR